MNKKASLVISALTVSVVPAVTVDFAMAADHCEIVLSSGSFNTTDYEHSSRILLSERDKVCKSEYASQSEAISTGRQAGGGIGFRAFSLDFSDAKQGSNSKWSIADSRFCQATAEDLDLVTSTVAKQQVVDVAVRAWSQCVESNNRFYVKYSLDSDGTGMTGTILRNLANEGGVGRILGIASSDPAVSVDCQIGIRSVEVNKSWNRPIKIDRARTAIVCNKPKEASVSVALITDIGDRDWISLPSQTEREQSTIEAANNLIAELKKQDAFFKEQLSESQRENRSRLDELRKEIASAQARVSGLSLIFTKNQTLFDMAGRGEEKSCENNDFVYGFKNALNNNQALDMWRCATIGLRIPPIE